MAKYLILIYGDDHQWAAMSDAEQRALDGGHRAFVAAAGSAILGTHALAPADVATTLRTDSTGRVVRMDGPFLETKEAVGGYYLVDVPDLDEATDLAALLYEASAGHSGVEIRPVASR